MSAAKMHPGVSNFGSKNLGATWSQPYESDAAGIRLVLANIDSDPAPELLHIEGEILRAYEIDTQAQSGTLKWTSPARGIKEIAHIGNIDGTADIEIITMGRSFAVISGDTGSALFQQGTPVPGTKYYYRETSIGRFLPGSSTFQALASTYGGGTNNVTLFDFGSNVVNTNVLESTHTGYNNNTPFVAADFDGNGTDELVWPSYRKVAIRTYTADGAHTDALSENLFPTHLFGAQWARDVDNNATTDLEYVLLADAESFVTGLAVVDDVATNPQLRWSCFFQKNGNLAPNLIYKQNAPGQFDSDPALELAIAVKGPAILDPSSQCPGATTIADALVDGQYTTFIIDLATGEVQESIADAHPVSSADYNGGGMQDLVLFFPDVSSRLRLTETNEIVNTSMQGNSFLSFRSRSLFQTQSMVTELRLTQRLPDGRERVMQDLGGWFTYENGAFITKPSPGGLPGTLSLTNNGWQARVDGTNAIIYDSTGALIATLPITGANTESLLTANLDTNGSLNHEIILGSDRLDIGPGGEVTVTDVPEFDDVISAPERAPMGPTPVGITVFTSEIRVQATDTKTTLATIALPGPYNTVLMKRYGRFLAPDKGSFLVVLGNSAIENSVDDTAQIGIVIHWSESNSAYEIAHTFPLPRIDYRRLNQKDELILGDFWPVNAPDGIDDALHLEGVLVNGELQIRSSVIDMTSGTIVATSTKLMSDDTPPIYPGIAHEHAFIDANGDGTIDLCSTQNFSAQYALAVVCTSLVNQAGALDLSTMWVKSRNGARANAAIMDDTAYFDVNDDGATDVLLLDAQNGLDARNGKTGESIPGYPIYFRNGAVTTTAPNTKLLPSGSNPLLASLESLDAFPNGAPVNTVFGTDNGWLYLLRITPAGPQLVESLNLGVPIKKIALADYDADGLTELVVMDTNSTLYGVEPADSSIQVTNVTDATAQELQCFKDGAKITLTQEVTIKGTAVAVQKLAILVNDNFTDEATVEGNEWSTTFQLPSLGAANITAVGLTETQCATDSDCNSNLCVTTNANNSFCAMQTQVTTAIFGASPSGDFDNDNIPNSQDCFTQCGLTNSTVGPGFAEICDGIDNSCDGNVDNDATLCDDGIACTIDTCGGAEGCTSVVETGFCLIDGACLSDQSPAGNDLCQVCNTAVSQTESTPAQDGSSCDDGDACTQSDQCLSGACTGSNPVDCGTSATCFEPGVCNPADGSCTFAPSASGTLCDDQNLNTAGDACDSNGTCAGTAIDCSTETTSTCTPTFSPDGTGCTPDHAALDTPCDDGSQSTANDKCDGAGTCAGTTIDCSAETTSTCTPTFSPDGTGCAPDHAALDTPCDDGSLSTANDKCDGAGTCAGTTIDCSAETTSTCTPSFSPDGTGCTPNHAAANVTCDDGDITTANDQCDGAGTCAGTAIDCSTETTSTCTPSYSPDGTGCSPNHAAADTSCDDQNLGTSSDTCDGAGTCVGTSIDCSGESTTTCTPSYSPDGTGCAPNFAVATTACDDGDLATSNDQCDGAGACNGTPIDCTDLPVNDCTIGYTTDGAECIPLTSAEGSECDDGDLCTTTDACADGACVGSEPIECTDTTCAINGACNAETGECEFEPVDDGTGCDDGDACTTIDTCDTGDCVGTDPIECIAGPCIVTSVCDPSTGACESSYEADGTACDDANACTEGETCSAGVCSGSDTTCDDGNSCTNDSCDPATGCINAPVTENISCDDGSACTSDDACVAGQCSGTTIDCNDNNICTTDSCDLDTGCVNDWNTEPCDDGDACTEGDECSPAGCSGVPVECSEGQSCQEGICTQDQCVSCTADADCADNAICTTVNGETELFCYPLCADSQCADGLTCTASDAAQDVCANLETPCSTPSGAEISGGGDTATGPVGDDVSVGEAPQVESGCQPVSAAAQTTSPFLILLLLVFVGLGPLRFCSTATAKLRQ